MFTACCLRMHVMTLVSGVYSVQASRCYFHFIYHLTMQLIALANKCRVLLPLPSSLCRWHLSFSTSQCNLGSMLLKQYLACLVHYQLRSKYLICFNLSKPGLCFICSFLPCFSPSSYYQKRDGIKVGG